MTERLTLRLSEAAELLGYSPSTFRRLVAEGKLPGPIDPAMSPKLRRWSRPLINRYVAADLTGRPGPSVWDDARPLQVVR